jgi:pimeloyl-ACP methyl ester carboxylesterase
MKKIISVLSTLFLTTIFTTVSWAQQQTLALSGNRVLAFESFQADQPGPVFIFLPGIYRGFSSQYEFVKLMQRQNMPYVLVNFAEHPDSVALTGKVTPDFSKTDADELANEVLTLVQHLKIKQPVPVTLSFSSIVTAHLDPHVFPAVIETSPIGKDTDELSPEVAATYEYWKAWYQLNPFSGAWFEQMRDTSLRQHWEPWITQYSERLPVLKKPEYHERAMQGYLALSHSAENFDFREQDFTKGPYRMFILGEKEEGVRKGLQQQGLKIYKQQTHSEPSVVTVPGAGHTVPVDQPAVYVAILTKVRAALSH